uniref:Methyltransferase domain-containing protein n=1 Tax=Candidatus Kentrum sp. UNK TaxID=2126344 RepID=A0A451ACG8_9GAMM|nr:MAG: Methyltransferase domain-containing protein [Candidatus Kentron sp. UNK]VFK70936.1 MAG: Methyltransferase domain-containing protein [Candidatus Kentron sp. UNK]
MRVTTKLRNLLYEPDVRLIDVDENRLLDIHREILQRKSLLRSAFETFYREMSKCCDHFLPISGLEIELGSGAGFFKRIRPDVVTSDIRIAPYIDRMIDADDMDLPEESVRCFYAINVFHHLPVPERFFMELSRTLKPGGGCILIEPHNGLASRLLHRYLHKDEHFNPKASTWKNIGTHGPMSKANQALAYIVFERDSKLFYEKYGKLLEIAYRSYCPNSFRYLFSGGLNFRQLLPSMTEPLLRKMENSACRWARYWSFHQIIVLKKL